MRGRYFAEGSLEVDSDGEVAAFVVFTEEGGLAEIPK